MKTTPSMTLQQLIRNRPLAVEILEKAAGHHVWEHLDDPLAEFCASRGLDAETLLASIAKLNPPMPGTDWDGKPIYYLVDYLVRNHEEIRDRDLPGIRQAMDLHGARCFPDSYVCKLMLQDFDAFESDFRKHMEEEEAFLFPKIMRNEACFRFQALEPEPYKGSVNIYLTTQTHKPEAEFKNMLIDIREKVRNQRVEPETAEAVRKVDAALEAFQDRLVAHADLETGILLSRAGRLEQELYASSAPGISRYPDKS